MIARLIFALLIACFMVGCGPRYVEYFPCHDDGTPKPKVALLPVENRTQGYAAWDIPNELTSGLYYQAMNSGELFLISPQSVQARLEGAGPIDYFNPDLSFANLFCGSDYVVALELVEHAVIPFQKEMKPWVVFPQKYFWKSVLFIKLRLRVIDLRYGEPRVVLQEIVTRYYPIPLEKENIDYSIYGWGSELFTSTPWGKAHGNLICELIARIESVVRGP